jgi:hypothetical protein
MRKTTEAQLELELSVHLEEYRAKTSDLTAEVNALHQTFALTVTAIGFVLAAAPFVVQFQVAPVFAAASLVFYGLTLTQLRHSWTVLAVEDYIAQSLRPAIQEILTTISPQRKESTSSILLWSAYGSRSAYTSRWWQFPIEFARYLIPVGAGFFCCVAYWITPSPRNGFIDAGVALINILAIGYIVVMALSMRNQFIKDKNRLKSNIVVDKNKRPGAA